MRADNENGPKCIFSQAHRGMGLMRGVGKKPNKTRNIHSKSPINTILRAISKEKHRLMAVQSRQKV